MTNYYYPHYILGGIIRKENMKTRTLSILFMCLASLCYLISAIATINAGEATGYRFYLQIIGGIIFFILAWRSYIRNSPKNQSEIN
jgi:hypothetical protein